VLAAFAKAFRGSYEPLLVVGWVISPKPEIEWMTTKEWILSGRDESALRLVASRSAASAAP
jgi:hypothetical protein